MSGFDRERASLAGAREPTLCFVPDLNRIAGEAPSPEDLLLEREAAAAEEPRAARAGLPAVVREALERLPVVEREAIVSSFAGGQGQRQIAARAGVSQPAINKCIRRALVRLRWMAGTGSTFTAEDLERDLAGVLDAQEVTALAIYWRTTSVAAIQREMPRLNHPKVWRVLRGAIAKLTGRYRRGFDDLVKHSTERLLVGLSERLGTLEDFIRSRLVFHRSARIERVSVVTAYQRHALANSCDPSPGLLVDELRRRGVRSGSVRAPWSYTPVRGLVGVRLQRAKAVDGGNRLSP